MVRSERKWRPEAALVMVAILLVPRAAQAEPDPRTPQTEQQDDVRALMRAGVAAYRKNDFQAARESFEKAFRIRPHAEIAASLAEVEMKLGRYRDALGHWEYYVEHAPSDRDEAEAQIAECRRNLGSFRVTVDTPGAIVVLDGNAIGPAPIDRDIWVDPGAHELHARLDERSSRVKRLDIAAGETHSVVLALAEPPPAQMVAPAAPAPQAHRSVAEEDRDGVTSRTVVLVAGVALTAVAAGVGIGYTVKADSAEDDALALQELAKKNATPETIANNSYCAFADRSPACDQLTEKLNERAAARDVAMGSFIAAGVLGVGTAAVYLLWPSAAPPDGRSALRVAPAIGQSHRGLRVELEF